MTALLILIFSVSQYSDNYLAIAESLYIKQDYYNAATEYERFIFYDQTSIDSVTNEIHYKLANCYYNNNEITRAEKITSYLMEKPNYFREKAQLLRVNYFISINEYFRAKIELSDLLLFSKNQVMLNRGYQLLGYIALLENESQEALRCFTLSQDSFLINKADELNKTPKKNPTVSQIMSTILPGSGEIYAHRCDWGILAMLVNAGCVYGIIDRYQKKQYLDAVLIFSLLFNRFYNGSRNNARDFALKYNEKIYQTHIKAFEQYIAVNK